MKSKLNFSGLIPKYLPAAVDSGRKKFQDIASDYHLSQVHTEGDTQAQALLLATSGKNYQEAERASALMYGLHFLDDRFDNPHLSPSPGEMAKNRGNIKEFLKEQPDINKVVTGLIKFSKHPEGFLKGLNRLRYGGLIQTAKNPKTQNIFLRELKKFGTGKDIAQDVSQDIAKLSNVAYWMTTKVDAELLESGYEAYSPTQEELWNLAFGPAVYLHDYREEAKKGELQFLNGERPTTAEMIQMIDIAKKHVGKYEKNPERRLQQVRLLRKTFEGVMPKAVAEAYAQLEKAVEKIPTAKPVSRRLEQRVLSSLGMGSLVASLIFFSSNLTGYVIAELPTTKTNLIGIFLFMIGLFILGLISKKRTIYYNQKTMAH